jgi:hypothetical protein
MTDEELMNRLEQLLTRPDPPAGATVHQLRRLAADDLSDQERKVVRAAVAENPELAARLAQIRAADDAFLAARPFEAVKEDLFARAALAPTVGASSPGFFARLFSRRAGFWSLAAVATALVLGLMLPNGNEVVGTDVTDPDRPANRLKGAAALEAWLDVEGHPQRVEPGVVLSAGDRLQFKITTTRTHLALLGVDGTGTVSRYVPVGGDVSADFVPGNARPLRDALVLDDAPGPEVFVAFLSDEPLLVEDLERALHDLLDAGGAAAVRDAAPAAFDVSGDVAIFHGAKVGR